MKWVDEGGCKTALAELVLTTRPMNKGGGGEV
jgi:hypothetical protein